jgi:hypothetical protein
MSRTWIDDLAYATVHGLLTAMRSMGCKVRVEGSGLLVTYPHRAACERFSGQVHAHRGEIRIVLNIEAQQARQLKELHDDYDDRRLDRRPNGSHRVTLATSDANRGTYRAYRAVRRDADVSR